MTLKFRQERISSNDAKLPSSMSDSDSSNSISVADIVLPTQKGSLTLPKASGGTGATYNSHDDGPDNDGSFADSDDESERPIMKAKNTSAKKSVKKPSSGEALPPGISDEAFTAFFSKELNEEGPDTKHDMKKNQQLDLDNTDHLLKQHYDLMTKSLSDLNFSQLSLKSLDSFLDEIEEDLHESDGKVPDKFVLDDINMKDATKIYKEEKKKKKERVISTPEVNELMLKKQKRDERLEKVRERIRQKEESKRMEKYHVMSLDMTEEGRRVRCYEWYKRLSMPSMEEMKEKILSLPPSSGILVDDIELLPWNPTGRVVNPRKMQMLSITTKISFRKPKREDAEDSD